jgi:hypothetical protein
MPEDDTLRRFARNMSERNPDGPPGTYNRRAAKSHYPDVTPEELQAVKEQLLGEITALLDGLVTDGRIEIVGYHNGLPRYGNARMTAEEVFYDTFPRFKGVV